MPKNAIRLSEIVPAHASFLGVSLKEAAYDLYEKFQLLKFCSYVPLSPLIPGDICWLGGVASDQKSARKHEIEFSALERYFNDWETDSPQSESGFECYFDVSFERVPASAIYFSRSALAGWFDAAEIGRPDFLVCEWPSVNANKHSRQPSKDKRELKTARKIISAAYELLHTVSQRGSALRDNAARLNIHASPGLKAKALKELTDLAGINLKLNEKTIAKFFPSEDELDDLEG